MIKCGKSLIFGRDLFINSQIYLKKNEDNSSLSFIFYGEFYLKNLKF